MSLLKNRVTLCNFICVALLLALVCVQLFMPFFTYESKDEAVEVSLGGYVWFPRDHRTLTSSFQHKTVFGTEFKIDEIAYPHLYMVILAGFGIVFCLLKYYSGVPVLFGLAVGIMSIYNFTTNRGLVVDPQYAERVTSNQAACTVNVILGVLLVLLALYSLFGGLIAKLLTKKAA